MLQGFNSKAPRFGCFFRDVFFLAEDFGARNVFHVMVKPWESPSQPCHEEISAAPGH